MPWFPCCLVALVTLLPLLPLLLWLPCCPCCRVVLLPWLPCCHGCLVALVALVTLVALLLCCFVALCALLPTIGDKIVETLFLNRVISENKRIRTPPLSPPFNVGVFVVFYRQLEKGHNIARRGWGRKLYFLLLKLIKRKKAQLRAKCLNSFCRRLSESKSTRCCPISTG